MKQCRLYALIMCVLLLALPASATNYLLHALPANVGSIVSSQGLALVSTIDSVNGVYVVSAPDSVPPQTIIAQVNANPNVISFEQDGESETPETQPKVLITQTLATVQATLKNRTVVSYFGVNVPSNYVTQIATNLIKLGRTQKSCKKCGGVGVVAVIDTGVDPNHPALQGVLVPGYDFVNNLAGVPNELNDVNSTIAGALQQSTAAILDNNQVAVVNQSTAAILDQSTAAILDSNSLPAAFGHGTMVAGIVHLVAPLAKIMPLKAFKADGTANVSNIISAIYYAVNNGATVINMSFSLDGPSTELARAINYASNLGVVLVASAGNQGMETLDYPAALRNVMGVASTDANDMPSTFTNFGNSLVSLSAPGEYVITTYPGGRYAAASGTSFSAPQVAGAAAMMNGLKHPNGEGWGSVINCLSHADPVVNAQGQQITNGMGYGRLDTSSAMQSATSN